MENSIRVPANYVVANTATVAMTRDELIHHTLNLMLFCLGLSTLFIGADVTATTPFTSTLLQIPVLMAVIGTASMAPALSIPRWLQRSGVVAMYAAILMQQLPAATPAVAVSVFAIVAITAFLAPTVIKSYKVSRTMAGVVVAGLVIVGLAA